MATKTSLTEDMKQAMRDKNAMKLGVIRFLLSEIKNVEIDEGELNEDGVTKVVARQIKQTKEAMEELKNSGRPELVEDEQAKLSVLETYMPAQMSEDELTTIVDEEIANSPDKHMGKIIGAVMKRVGNQADGTTVSTIVRKQLS